MSDSRHRIAALIDALVREFEAVGRDTATHVRGPDELAQLTHLREAFIAAGAERVRALLEPERWLQVGLSVSDPERHRALLADGRLRIAVERWLDAGLIASFFFMNKPPGVRLRFCSPGPLDALTGPLDALLAELLDARLIDAAERGIYDQEIHQFGGERGIAIFHRYSTHDSLSALRFRELLRAGRNTVDEGVMSLLGMTELVSAVSGDPWEAWDIWCEMASMGRLPVMDAEEEAQAREDLAENRELLEAILQRRHEVVAELGEVEQAIFARYRRAALEAAEALRSASRDGQLDYGPRKLVPAYIVFHWNRIGLAIDRQIATVWFMRALLDPKHAR